MLEVVNIRNKKEDYIERLEKRGLDARSIFDEIIALDDERKQTQQSTDAILTESNAIAKQIGDLFKSGKREEAEILKAKPAALKEEVAILKEKSKTIEDQIQQKLYAVPNVPHVSVPAGKDENDNDTIYEHGDIPKLHEGALPHWELAKKYNLINFELGVKITGAGFPVYTGKGAALQRALINFFLNEAIEAGFQEVIPPLLVNEASGIGTGQLPDKEGQMYYMPEDDLYLIPTAEVPITNIYRDEIVDEASLPIKMCGYTPCFRREAGSYGKHVRGLNRLHQFDKVEIVIVQHPDKSYETLDQMADHVKGLHEKLGLPYRVLRLCGGDTGFAAALTFDMEVYSAGQERWLETSSVSNFETFQATRLKLRMKDKDNNKQLAHTLNGSALALPRILAALLENYQTPEGIVVPEVLRKYTGFDIIN
ncbi:MAG: seryl-tRNA synthetase [Patiriisocius sp.]|jgi:seryl-tRNA synthetase